MKSVLFIAIGLVSTFSMASSIEETYSPITKGTYQVRTPAPSCPPRAMCAPVTFLDITVPLSGCMDNAIVSYKIAAMAQGKKKVTVSALNIKNPLSASTRCLVAPTKSVSLMLGTGILSKENVVIEFIDSIAQKTELN